jgi:NADPH:quinone reductase-like Zn-dependent oxidoreductase
LLPLHETVPYKEAEAAGVQAVFMLVEPDRQGLREITKLVEDGRLQMIADAVFPLENAAAAHMLGETGRTTGKIVLSVAS